MSLSKMLISIRSGFGPQDIDQTRDGRARTLKDGRPKEVENGDDGAQDRNT